MSETALERWQPRAITTVPTSRKSLEEVAEAARQKGYSEGLAKGQAEARAQSEVTASELAALWESMKQPISDNDIEVSEHLLSLVMAISKSVLARELETDAEFIKQTLDQALTCLAESEASLVITLHPADKSLVETLLAEQRIEAELVADAAMVRGGCRLTRGHALVDASIESRIKSLIEKIAEADTSQEPGDLPAAALDPDRIQAITERFSGNGDD